MIDTTKSIDDIYKSLCIEYRELTYKKEQGLWVCTHCEKTDKEHYHGRCTSYVTSWDFNAKEQKRYEFVKDALVLLDDLKDLKA